MTSGADRHGARRDDTVGVGLLEVETDCSEARFGSSPLALTWAQRRVLLVLLARQGRMVDRMTLYRESFGRQLAPGSRAVDVHVGRIRRQLDAHCSGAIITIDRVGYRIDVDALHYVARVGDR